MFTGIITDVGTLAAIDLAAGYRVQIQTKFDVAKIPLGASIACNGVCLTNIEVGRDWFAAQISEETRAKTTAGEWHIGTKLNLERALALGDELGGHMVLGHVDGVAQVKSIEKMADSTVITIVPPPELLPLIAPKGSICLDGISLTVNAVMPESFSITIVPHTLQNTHFSQIKTGNRLNIEIDMVARYLHRFWTMQKG